jgi:hypothetical protein
MFISVFYNRLVELEQKEIYKVSTLFKVGEEHLKDFIIKMQKRVLSVY